jgi:hypothetical protein
MDLITLHELADNLAEQHRIPADDALTTVRHWAFELGVAAEDDDAKLNPAQAAHVEVEFKTFWDQI